MCGFKDEHVEDFACLNGELGLEHVRSSIRAQLLPSGMPQRFADQEDCMPTA
jgi:hypothetical protein